MAQSGLSKKVKQEEEVGRLLAESRVAQASLKAERDKLAAELRTCKHQLLERTRADRSEFESLESERNALEEGLAQRSMETSQLTEALRQREASEAAARKEAAVLRERLQSNEEEQAKIRQQLQDVSSNEIVLLNKIKSLESEQGNWLAKKQMSTKTVK